MDRFEELELVGSGGSFRVSAATGRVATPLAEMPDEYRHICRVDLMEYEAYWGVPATGSLDILDTGYWSLDGDYHAPEYHWRDLYVLVGAYKDKAVPVSCPSLEMSPAKTAYDLRCWSWLRRSGTLRPEGEAALEGLYNLLGCVRDAFAEIHGDDAVFGHPSANVLEAEWSGAPDPVLLRAQLRTAESLGGFPGRGALHLARQVLEAYDGRLFGCR